MRARAGETVRIVSWNIRAGGGRRADHIAERLGAWEADVVALSEFRGTAPSGQLRVALERLGLSFQACTVDPMAPVSNCLLVAARWPLRTLRLRSAPVDRGRWGLAAVDAPRPFFLGAMHVPNRVSGRKYPFHAAVLRVAQSWRRGPALLVGDTNSGRIGVDEETRAFNRREDSWMVALESSGWRDAFRYLRGDAQAYTWYSPNGRNGFRIDQAFVNRRLMPRLIDARYEWAVLPDGDGRNDRISDHAAMIVDLDS